MVVIERTAPRSRFVATLVGIALGWAALGVNPTLARAQSTPPPSAQITLAAQDAWTVSGGQLKVRLLTPTATGADSITVTAHSAITSRSVFDRIVNGGNASGTVSKLTLPLSNYPDLGGGERAVAIGIGDAETPAGAVLSGLRAPGVYPITFAWGDDRFTTFAVVVAPELFGGAQILSPRHSVALVWPLTTGPARLPSGATDPTVTAALAPTGRIGRQVVALARHPGLPVTVAPGPNTVATRNGANDRNSILGAITPAQVLGGPYVPINIPALIDAQSSGIADSELALGNTLLNQYLPSPPDIRTAIINPVTTAALALLRIRGTSRVVVSNLALVNGIRATPSAPFALPVTPTAAVNEPHVSAVASDDGLTNLLRSADPALAAQQVLAGLALNAYAYAGEARGTVLVNPNDLDAPETTFDALLTGLRNHPLLEAITLDTFFGQIPAARTATGAIEVRELTPYRAPPLLVKPAILNATALQVAALRTFVGPDSPEVDTTEQWLLSTPSATFTGTIGAARAEATLAQTRASIAQILAQIEVPNPGTITLTSEIGSIPLTFRNNLNRSVRIKISLASEKLTFPNGGTQEIELPPANTTARIPVQARTPGTFPLRLSVTSADGFLVIANQEFEVRSTAVSAIGVVLMVGAVVVLALWWILDARRRRRRRRENNQAEQ